MNMQRAIQSAAKTVALMSMSGRVR